MPRVPGKIVDKLASNRVCRAPLAQYFPDYGDSLLVCVTEIKTKEDIDSFVSGWGRPAFEHTTRTEKIVESYFEKSCPGRAGVPFRQRMFLLLSEALIPEKLRRQKAPVAGGLRAQVVRHFTRSPSQLFHRHSFLPSGVLHHETQPQGERPVGAIADFAGLHPLRPILSAKEFLKYFTK